MRLQTTYPVLLVDDPAAARDFFAAHLGFAVSFEADWYVSLRHADAERYELAFVRRDHETVPAAKREAARGVLLNFGVPDAAAEWERLRGVGAPVLLPLRDEAFGQRHFILEGPGGVMIDVIQNIPPSPEFAAQYAQS